MSGLINSKYFDIFRYLNFLLGKISPLIKNDELFLKWKFYASLHKWPNFKNPKTFNEKLNWLKLYDRRPIYTTMVDKIKVKNYVANIIGKEYIIPTLGVWNSPDEIDFNSLPDQFVLKCNHDSGGLFICKDKGEININKIKRKLKKSLNSNFYIDLGREWPYKNVERKVLAEQYMEDETGELRDFKFFCFDGIPKFMFIAKDRQKKGEDTKFDFFDMEFNHLPFVNGHPNSEPPYEKPKLFNEMKLIASRLSKDIPEVRVDLYYIDGKIYFGELTFFHWSGLTAFEPKEWDYELGKLITLPLSNA